MRPATLLLLFKLRPVTLVGLDHVVENLLGDLHRRHGLVERKGLKRLLVRTLDRSLDNELLGVQLLHHEALLEQRMGVTAEKAIALLDELETAGVIDFYDGRYYLAKADSEEE